MGQTSDSTSSMLDCTTLALGFKGGGKVNRHKVDHTSYAGSVFVNSDAVGYRGSLAGTEVEAKIVAV